MTRLFSHVLVALALLLPAWARAGVDLGLFTPAGFGFGYLIPVQDGEKVEVAWERYLKALETKPALSPFGRLLRENTHGRAFKTGKCCDAQQITAIAVANDPDDLTAAARRMHEVMDPVAKRGATVHLAPIAVTEGLSEKDAAEFRAKVNRSIDLLVSVGGDDIDPAITGQQNRFARNVNGDRDIHEFQLVKSWFQDGKGFFYGDCRGAQLGAEVGGCPLIQDIQKELNVIHPVGQNHKIQIRDGDAGELTRRVFGGERELEVNSYHHQALKQGNANVKVTGETLGPDGKRIPEVYEFFGGRGLGLQFHTEWMGATPLADRVSELLYEKAAASRTQRLGAVPRIDRNQVLFGIEYTFQDQTMVNEPGRMTFATPHKKERYEAFRDSYLRQLGVTQEKLSPYGYAGFKEGVNIDVPGDGRHVMDMEPVSIEVNTPPKKFDEIEGAAMKVYQAAGDAKLVPYVQPAAERSGMGHLHVGGATLGENPFFRNPHLLRNMMVYIHQHPSVLWGFAEAYDLGLDSNIESYHSPERQEKFQKAVEKFDAWYQAKMAAKEDVSDGLRQFLLAIQEQDRGPNFFHHYRYINLEHLKKLATAKPIDPQLTGKQTVEFRNFRPPKSPLHAKADAELLLSLMEKLSEPGYLVPFRQVDANEYGRFHTASKIAADWIDVKATLPRKNPLWDEMIQEYVDVQARSLLVKTNLAARKDVEIYPSYSEKSVKGQKFEIRFPAVAGEAVPRIELEGNPLDFEKLKLGNTEYWVGSFTAEGAKLSPQALDKIRDPQFCQRAFRAIF